MTITNAIKANPVFASIDGDYIESVLTLRSINGSEEYTSSSLKDFELASADIYLALAMSPEFREGQLSVKMNSGLLRSRAEALYAKHGETDKLGNNTIEAIDV